MGHNPSYVWRSILYSRFIVRGGSRWSIGSGTSIPILDEPWLSNGGSIYGNIIGEHFVCDFPVDSLMDTNSKSWNDDVVKQVFSEDIAYILNTPLFDQVPNAN